LDEAGSFVNLENKDLLRKEAFEREINDIRRKRDEEMLNEDGEERFKALADLKSKELRLQTRLAELGDCSKPVEVEHLAKVIELWTKIPASKITETEFIRLNELENRLKSKIIGQDEAVAAVAAAIRRGRAGISPKRKPISFLFAGPTGVGKTELVRRLAMDLFDQPEALIRLDMSEFMEKHAVSRIIGAPPGYVGYDEAGQLTEKIRRKPYSVVLFDEIEKAHPDVMNILLQILDDGRITDAQGRKVSFENTVIVMTTNAGSTRSSGAVGFGRTQNEQNRERLMKALEDFLRPEFINRIDEIITFNTLTKENFKDIANLMLTEMQEALSERGIKLNFNEEVTAYLAEKSFSGKFGARNLRRFIQKEVEDKAAARIIAAANRPVSALKVSVDSSGIIVTEED
jgi:ATP-dependent Clp protease ATP-binding subunit ClpC